MIFAITDRMYDYLRLNQQLTLIDSNSGIIVIVISVYKNFQFLLDMEIIQSQCVMNQALYSKKISRK